MERENSKKNKILEFAENHPYILLAVISVLLLLIVFMYLSARGVITGIGSGASCRRKKKREPLDDEEEMDELIDAIHSKQKKRARTQ